VIIQLKKRQHSFLLIASIAAIASGQVPEQRTAFTIPLPKLYVAKSNGSAEVRIQFNDSKDQFIIAGMDDSHIIDTRMGRETRIYAESITKAYGLSDFEARQMDKVAKALLKTLDMLEHDLQHSRWDRCLYLDAFFPRFMQAYYYLYCTARNSGNALPRSCRIPDDSFDVSVNSLKSDARIQCWRTSPDHIIKFRIIIKELIYQIKLWQKSELQNLKRNPDQAGCAKFEEAYGIFVKMYFCDKPPPALPEKGKHL
jgi:hypothetical protein